MKTSTKTKRRIIGRYSMGGCGLLGRWRIGFDWGGGYGAVNPAGQAGGDTWRWAPSTDLDDELRSLREWQSRPRTGPAIPSPRIFTMPEGVDAVNGFGDGTRSCRRRRSTPKLTSGALVTRAAKGRIAKYAITVTPQKTSTSTTTLKPVK